MSPFSPVVHTIQNKAGELDALAAVACTRRVHYANFLQ